MLLLHGLGLPRCAAHSRMAATTVAGAKKERVADYPRPPALEPCSQRLGVLLRGKVGHPCGPRSPLCRRLGSCRRGLCNHCHRRCCCPACSVAYQGQVPFSLSAKRCRALLAPLQVVADTSRAFRVLETHHPPAYYLPPADVKTELLSRSEGRCFAVQRGGANSRPGSGR